MNKENISYTALYDYCQTLAEKIQESKQEIKTLVAVTRGGLFPTLMLAQLLSIKDIRTICISSYKGTASEELEELFCANIPDNSSTLFVDDLIDSGRTFLYIKDRFPNSLFAVIFQKASDNFQEFLERYTLGCVNYFAEMKSSDTWIEFPWEVNSLEEQKNFLKQQKLDQQTKKEYINEVVEDIGKLIPYVHKEPDPEELFTSTEGFPLSEEQRKVIKYLENKRGQLTLLTGRAGSGKSTIIKTLLKRNKSWSITSTTGKSAVIVGGKTVDSFFAFIRGEKYKCFSRHVLEQNMKESGKVIIVDEASMMGKQMFEYVYTTCVRFGKHLVLVGDWGQASPVKDNWIFESNLFIDDVRCISLTECHRQASSTFLDVLDKIRKGEVDSQVQDLMKTRVMSEIPEGDTHLVLYATNKLVNSYNEKKVGELAEKTNVKPFMLNVAVSERAEKITEERLQQIIDGALLPNNEKLCVGCKVLITRNNMESGYVNGDTGVLLSVDSGYEVLLDRNKHIVYISLVKDEIKDAKDQREVVLKGYPIKAGYALTVHKSQGMTIPKVWVHMSGISHFSSHGICYVAFSRVREVEDLLIDNWCASAIYCDSIVKEYL